MISVIICTTNLNKISAIERNISTTVGLEFELIVIDNCKSQYNIFQAYNRGVKMSQFPILCFMHDDIVYHSKGWGNEVLKHFNSSDTGMIGIGGTRFLSSIPSVWWAGGHKFLSSKSGTICHNSVETNRNDLTESRNNIVNPEKGEYSKVVILDGLWFCIRKSLFESIEFDEINYCGFHFYDLDICMQLNKLNFNILCVFNIQIEHVSSSKLDKEWIANCEIFYHKWKSFLPNSLVKLSNKQLFHIELKSLKIIRRIYASNKTNFSYRKLVTNISIINVISFHLKTFLRVN